MSRPGDITGKTVTARLPMEDYIKVLQSATGQNLSVSEYVLLKLFTEERETALKAEIEQLKTDLAQQAEFTEKYKSISAKNIENSEAIVKLLDEADVEKAKLQKEVKDLKELIDVLSDTGGKEYDELKANYTKVKTSYEAIAKTLEKEKQERVNAIETIKLRASIAENLWNEVHKKNGSVPAWMDTELKKISRY